MYRLANLPESLVRSILDDRQWTLLDAQIDRWGTIRQYFVEQGMIAADGEENVPEAPRP